MDLHALSLPDWLPWWAVVAVLVPAALWLAMFLLMPFTTFGLGGRMRELEQRIDALHEEMRGLTLRLPERGLDPYGDRPAMTQPPIPPAARDAEREATRPPGGGRQGFGDPVADKMLAYMREKAQSELHRADAPRPTALRARVEPRLTAPAPDLPPPPPIAGLGGAAADPEDGADLPPPPPRATRLTGRFANRMRPSDSDG